VPILAVPLLKAELARHLILAFERSLEVLRAMGVRVLFDPSAPPQARMPSWPKVLEELHAVIGDCQAGGTEWPDLRNVGTGSHMLAAAVACPRPRWLG
jgi:hypothetical protein